jgi:hypothetical protein
MKKLLLATIVTALCLATNAQAGTILEDLKAIANGLGLVYVDVDAHYGKAYYIFTGKDNGWPLIVAIPADIQSPEAMACSMQAGYASVQLTKELHCTRLTNCMADRVADSVVSPSFSTRGVCDPGSRSKTSSWSKGLHYKRALSGVIEGKRHAKRLALIC